MLCDEHADVIRESVRLVVQELMEGEVAELIGAQRGEGTEHRATHRTSTATRLPAATARHATEPRGSRCSVACSLSCPIIFALA